MRFRYFEIFKKYNPIYYDIDNDENRLSQFPDSGIPEGFKIVHKKET